MTSSSCPCRQALLDEKAEIVRAVGEEPPIDATRSAVRSANRTGLDADRADVETLAERGTLAVVGWFKDWPLYACPALDGVDAGDLAEVIAERQAWLAESLPLREAAERFGWDLRDLERLGGERGVLPGRFGRYSQAELDVLAADEDLVAQVAAERLLGPDQSAAHLKVRLR